MPIQKQTPRDRLRETAEQWYPGKGKDIWGGSQSRRFESLTDPRRLSAERAMKGLVSSDVEGAKSSQAYKENVGLERLKQQGAMGLQQESSRAALETQRVSNVGAMARERLSEEAATGRTKISTAPSLLESRARFGKGGMESQNQELKRGIFNREYGQFPGEGLRNRQLDVEQGISKSKGEFESSKFQQETENKEYDLYLKQFADPISGGLLQDAPDFNEWRTKKKNPSGADGYLSNFLSSYGAGQ